MEIVQSRIVWEGKWRLRVETLRLPDGHVFERGAIDHPGAVVIAPLLFGADGAPLLLMLRQHRHTLDQTILELPAGTREPDEPWLECAQRELREETGQRAAHFMPLGEIWPAPGLTNERMALFLATDLSPDPLPMDVDEAITVEAWPLAALVEMALDGRLEDGKSVVTVLRVAKEIGYG
ncbi:ADP-ribose pyrophosphatase [Candidatus Promineifilum breve]|uniref:ADP-ribose pyrophosphatase n=1 Tax=Candidatus Promineifilum breve TaxID=1806508 RepID=A0A160T574_9CHLR|nr:NUDIX hydrolase [Candidatus Promineifilum breve]CUS04609.2 ADP-ribose pyrophosphatase [Candidatus Promineifilum breve]